MPRFSLQFGAGGDRILETETDKSPVAAMMEEDLASERTQRTRRSVQGTHQSAARTVELGPHVRQTADFACGQVCFSTDLGEELALVSAVEHTEKMSEGVQGMARPPATAEEEHGTACMGARRASASMRQEPDSAQEEFYGGGFDDVDELQAAGISALDCTKLREAGYLTLGQVAMETIKSLCAVRGLSEAKVEKVKAAVKGLVCYGFRSGSEVAAQRQSVYRISTGSRNLDELLGGGINSQELTEVFGEFRTGKTQLCHTLCVTAQMSRDMGGGEGMVAYLDTEGTFRPENIAGIARRYGMDVDAVLDNIRHVRIHSHEHLNEALVQATALFMEAPFRALIIDSIIQPFRTDFAGRAELSERQQKLNHFCARLLKVASEFNIAVMYTNQIMSDPSAGSTGGFAPTWKPAGGHVLAHASTTRLYLRKGAGGSRVCKMYDSPCRPEGEASFALTDGGIVDFSG